MPVLKSDMHQIQLLKKYGLSVRGARGQHLLVDENVQRKLIACVKPRPNEPVIEIGPGLGALTELLLAAGACVTAIEQDERFIQILNGELGGAYHHLKLVHGDILKIDLAKYVKRGTRVKVIGNIPYYITSPILLHLIEHRHVIDAAYLTVQREIADRIFAQPGTKQYGRLSLLVRFYSDVDRKFEISRHCFSPKPDVDSTFLEIEFRARQAGSAPLGQAPVGRLEPRYRTVGSVNEALLFDLIKAGFGVRRKNILNALARHFLSQENQVFGLSKGELVNVLSRAGISGSARAEDLMLKDFVRLTEHLTLRLNVPQGAVP